MSIPNARSIKIDIPQSEIDHFKQVIQLTRLPDEPIIPGADDPQDEIASYGTKLSDLKDAKEKLLNFDWRKTENEMNQWHHFMAEIESTQIHFIHEKSPEADAIPLLLLHGWAFSFWEYKLVIEPLLRPPAGQQAFHVVLPSLPGVFLSSVIPDKNHGTADVARIFNSLMVDVLGYKVYGAQGGDFGAVNLRQVQLNHADNCKLIHFNGFPAPRPAGFTDDALENLPDHEKRLLKAQKLYEVAGMGYLQVQTTEVTSIGYALYDGLGMASWLVGKYHGVLKHAKVPEELKEQVFLDFLVGLLIYQFTRSNHTSMLMYKQSGTRDIFGAFGKVPGVVGAPMGVSLFEGEFFFGPKAWIEESGNLIFYKYHEEGGGHVPALAQPQLLVDDLRELFSTHWGQVLNDKK